MEKKKKRIFLLLPELNKEIKICHDVYKEYGKGNINEYYLAAFKLALEKYQNITKENKHE